MSDKMERPSDLYILEAHAHPQGVFYCSREWTQPLLDRGLLELRCFATPYDNLRSVTAYLTPAGRDFLEKNKDES